MAHVLDLSGSHQYTLDLTLNDDDRTKLRVGMPTEALANELQALVPELHKLTTGDRECIELIYDLAARLISRNRDYIKITAKELREKYRMDVESAIVFFNAYLGFIQAIIDAKN